MAATPAVMQQLQKTGTTYIPGGLPPNSGGAPPQLVKPSVSPIQGGLPPVMPTPAPSTPQIGGEQSLTPGQIIFTEYQARVFNQTEATIGGVIRTIKESTILSFLLAKKLDSEKIIKQ